MKEFIEKLEALCWEYQATIEADCIDDIWVVSVKIGEETDYFCYIDGDK